MDCWCQPKIVKVCDCEQWDCDCDVGVVVVHQEAGVH
jgi:hypothetical protein